MIIGNHIFLSGFYTLGCSGAESGAPCADSLPESSI
jgi:hypothetical protein